MRERNRGALGNLLDGCPHTEEYLLDNNNWVFHALLQTLYDRMVAITGDENAVYKMALASERFQSLGLLDRIGRLLGTPRLVFAYAPRYNKLLKLNGDALIHDLGPNWVILEDRYHRSAQKTRHDYDCTRGLWPSSPPYSACRWPRWSKSPARLGRRPMASGAGPTRRPMAPVAVFFGCGGDCLPN